jgi:predicted ATPase
MLVAITATHGTGKTTLLNELAFSGFNVDNFKVSRSIQKHLGYNSLDEIDSFEKMKEFQEKVLEAKFDHDYKLKNKNELILVERSFLDILAYAEHWVSRFNLSETQIKKWLNGYTCACLKSQSLYDATIFIHPHQDLLFEHDKNRASLETQNKIHSRLSQLCQYEKNVLSITDLDLSTRVSQSINFLKGL